MLSSSRVVFFSKSESQGRKTKKMLRNKPREEDKKYLRISNPFTQTDPLSSDEKFNKKWGGRGWGGMGKWRKVHIPTLNRGERKRRGFPSFSCSGEKEPPHTIYHSRRRNGKGGGGTISEMDAERGGNKVREMEDGEISCQERLFI